MEEAEEIEESSNSCSASAPASASSASMRGKRHCTEMRSEKPAYLRQKEKIIYPRNTRTLTKTAVIGGKPIDQETCMLLRSLVYGSAATPPRPEWSRTGFTLRPYGQSLAFGLRTPRNTTRGLVTAVQAVMLKHFLFKCNRQDSHATPEILLKPSYDRQIDVLTASIAEIIWRCADGFAVQSTGCSPNQSVTGNANVPRAVVVLPQDTPYVQHSVQYFQDGLTETLHLFEFESLQELEIFIKRYLYLFQDEGSPGAILLLYSALLSRSLSKVRGDLEDPKASILSGCPEEGPTSIIMLSLTGRASPHLHNGVMHVGDENTYAIPQWGVLVRSEIGFLVHEGDGQMSKTPGSRLKTPSLPIWVTLCHGHHGVLFNTNRELLRNYHAERRFEIQYFTCGGSHAILTVDTRSNSENDSEYEGPSKDCLDIAATPLEKLIRSKWQDAYIQWNCTPLM